MHRIVVDHSRALVSMTAIGHITLAELNAAAADLHGAIRSLGLGPGQHATLYDLSGLRMTSADVLQRFTGYFTDPDIAPLWARRVALVTASPLVRLQLEQVGRASDTLRLFWHADEAIAWLFADHERPRTTSHPTAASG